MASPASSPKQSRKLPPIDALVARIFVNNALEKVQVLHSTLPRAPNSQSSGQELTDFVGAEIGRIIGEQRVLEDENAKLQKAKNSLKNPANAPQLLQVNLQISECSSKLKESYVKLYRWLKETPDIEENKAKTKSDRSRVIDALEIARRELDYEMTFEKLANWVKLEREDLDRLDELRRLEKELVKEIAEIQSDLTWENEQFSNENEKADSIVRKLKDDLAQVRSLGKMEIEFEDQKLLAEQSVNMHANSMAEMQMREELEKAKTAVEREKLVAEITTRCLAQRVEELTKSRSEWTEKSEKDLATMEHVTLPELAEKQKSVSTELEVLRARKAKEMELARLADEKEEQLAAEAVWEKKHDAALPGAISLLQTVGRRFLEAKAAVSQSKKSKGGKKGKK